MQRLFFLAVFLLLLSGLTYAYEIAITFDDLPSQQGGSVQEQLEINEHILEVLKKFKAPAIGFVNEIELYNKGKTEERIGVVKLWVDNGYPLGNHTYSHKALSKIGIDEFKEDVIKGSIISGRLMKETNLDYKYFRYPYLDTGNNKDTRKASELFLKQEGYVIAPVTVDTYDWVFNRQLRRNPADKDRIIAEYIDYTKVKLGFCKEASEKAFGNNIRHIWLLHVNSINAYAIEDLLRTASSLGYRFITLDRALEENHDYKQLDKYYSLLKGSSPLSK